MFGKTNSINSLIIANGPRSAEKTVTNLSKFQLSDTQLEALIFGQKFATGIPKYDTTDYIIKNHHHNDTEFTKGYIQGLITATQNKYERHRTSSKIHQSPERIS